MDTNIAVLASGNGSNFEAIARSKIKGGRVKLLLTDRENAYVRTRAKRLGIPDVFINPQNFSSRLDFDKEAVRILKKEKIGLVVLAGFMRILSPYFVKEFRNKIINIHPALLPAFRGLWGHKAFETIYNSGVKISGVTIHFVDEEVDHGQIILQGAVEIKENDSLSDFENRVHRLEHKLYPQAVKLFVQNRIKIKANKTVISKPKIKNNSRDVA